MKNKYKFSLTLIGAIMLNTQNVQAQVYNIAENSLIYAGGVSDNGVVSLNKFKEIFKWDQANGLVQIGATTASGPFAGVAKISNDGKKIAAIKTNTANSLNEMSLYDVDTQTWQLLGGIAATGADSDLSSSWGMTADGNTIVGLGWVTAGIAHAIRWDAATGMTDLGSITAGRSSRANAISDDKTTIVGWQDQSNGQRSGAKWVNGVEEYIKDSDNNFVNDASGVSADGNTIVGNSMNYQNGSVFPYVWNSTAGFQAVSHPNSSIDFIGSATAVSADGNTVIGYFRDWNGAPMSGEGFIWTPTGGRKNLNDYVVGLGMDPIGINFGLPLAISKDGKKITGIGLKTGAGNVVAFYIDLTAALLKTENVSSKIFAIAPNPVKDFLTISGGKIESADVYSITGQKMKSLKIANNKADVSSLSKGIYILQVVSEGKKQNIKLIKE